MGRKRKKHWASAMSNGKPSTAMFTRPVDRTPAVQFSKGVADGAASVGRGTWRAVTVLRRISRLFR